MSVKKRHTLYAVQVDATMLQGVMNTSLPIGTNVVGEGSDGEVYPRIKAIAGQSPVGNWTTVGIAAALDLIGASGYDIASGAGLTLYAQKHADGATREAGATHVSYAMAAGMAVPLSLTCEHQATAQLTYAATAKYNGSVDPVVINPAATLPALADMVERFSIGPVQVDGTVLEGVRNIEIDFGITLSVESADSDIWPTHVSVEDISPMIRLTGIDVDWFGAAGIGLGGAKIDHVDTEVWLRKREDGGTYVAETAFEHVKFTGSGLATVQNSVIGSEGNEPMQTTLELALRFDGTNAPLIVDTAAQISAP